MLMAEEYLLLMLTADGRTRASSHTAVALGGAMLCELAERERLDVDERGRLRVVNAAPTGDALLDLTLEDFAARVGKKPKDVLARTGRPLRKAVPVRMAQQDVVRREDHRFLGLVPWTRWPVLDGEQQAATQTEIVSVLTGPTPPTARTVSLIGLVHAVGQGRRVFAGSGLTGRDLKRRVRELGEGDWAGAAVQRAIRDAQAVVGAMGAAGAVAGGS